MGTRLFVLGSVILAPALAAGEASTPVSELETTAPTIVYGQPGANGAIFARQIVEDLPPSPIDQSGTMALAASRTIYLNKNGATLTAGNTNNSGTNVSTIVPGTRAFPAWNVSVADWATVRSAVQEMFAPFGVTVSDQPPPPGTRHVEALFGGTAADALPASQVPPPSQGVILGVSPFTPSCAVIEDSIVFTFAASAVQVGVAPREIAEIAAQEIAHSFGLDHVLNASDPMTYLPYNGNRSFKAGAVSCGESTPRACGLVTQGFAACRTNQDSVALLTERIGTGGGIPTDTIPPTTAITAPRDNALVPRGFAVYATAEDNVGVTSVDLYVDDVLVATAASAPYTFTTSPTLGLGDHVVTIVATDGQQQATQTITVTVDDDADPVLPPGGSDDPNGDLVTGGCTAGGHGAGAVLGLALFGLVRRRRT